MTEFSNRTRIIAGQNALDSVDFSELSRVAIFTDKVMMKLGICDSLCEKLTQKGVEYVIFDDIEPDPSLNTVRKGVTTLIDVELDAMIAVGGGSVIDAAKAISYFSLKTLKKMGNPRSKPLCIAIPTTSGTGSEVTAYTVITDTENKLKIPLKSDSMIPDIAILDPYYTMSVPPHVTADTGIDVLTHVLESYVCTLSSPFTKPYAEEATIQVFHHLITCYKDGNNLEARLAMLEASCIAGIAFNNSGLGLNHAMAHALGGQFKIPHGRSNAVLLPHVLRFNNKGPVTAQYAHLARLLEFTNYKSDKKAAQALITGVEMLCRELNIPATIADLNIDKKEFLKAIPIMAQHAIQDTCLTTNPIPASVKEIEEIYACLL